MTPARPAHAPAALAGEAPRARLETGLAALGLDLPPAAVTQLCGYLGELVRWNAAYNLTAVRAPEEMVTRHLLDSLSILPLLDRLLAGVADRAPRLLDVGAGAGLPCIPLAIARPQWAVAGLDSNGKKARFMRHAGRVLGLANFTVIEGRAEDLAEADELGYDLVTSRAFAALGEFFAHTDHRLAPGGRWLAMKAKLDDELRDLPANVVVEQTLPLAVPGLVSEVRHAVIARLRTDADPAATPSVSTFPQ